MVYAVMLAASVFAASAQSYHPRTLYIQAIRFDVACGSQPRSVPAGTDVWIGIVVRNISDESITYRNVRWTPSTVLEVRDESGNLVPETEQLQQLKEKYFHDGKWIGPPPGTQWWEGPMPDDTTVLQPDGQISFSFLVSKYYDVSRPGTYSIIAKLRSDEPNYEWFYSNEIQVTVTPKTPTP